jgi:colicin import membrane protein
MNRLHKKCAIASAGLHALLVLILFIGPGFLSSKEKAPDMPLLDFVPVETVDALMSGGGNPNAQPPPAQPNVQPQPVPAAPPPRPPEPTPQPREPEVRKPAPEPEPEPTKPQPAALEPTPAPKKKPQLTLKPVVRKGGESKAVRESAAREAREYSEYRKKLASAIGSTATGIPGSISSSTTIEFKGPGGGGIPYANWLQAVKSAYTHAWELPEGVTDDDATVATTVTIGRDGNVISARITRRSGNSAVDESVRATLDRVTYAAKLPRDAKEDRRTVTINFNVRAKRLAG